MADSFNWSGLLGAAQKSHNNPLYSALLGARGTGNSQAATGFLNDKQLNPMTMTSAMGNAPGFQSSNPGYINPHGWGTPTTPTAPGSTPAPAPAPTPSNGLGSLKEFENADWSTLPWASSFDPTSIINTAGAGLTQALKSGLARGQLTQQGYDAGLQNYNTDMTNAQSWAKSFLSGQDTNEEQSLINVVKNAKAAQNGPGYSWDPFAQQIQDITSNAQTSLPSALKSGLASNGFFAVAPAIAAAGTAQGAYNAPESDELLKALMAQTGKSGANSFGGTRQLGNVGTF